MSDAAPAPVPPPLRIGEHLFDARTGELAGPAGRARLRPQQAALLAMLAERPGELVTREELRARLWPDTQVEFDQGLAYGLRQLRIALCDDADAPRYIETLPKRGYRLVAPVSREVGEAAPRETAPVAARATTPRRAVVGGVATVLLGLSAWVWAAVRPGREPAPPLQLLAVLALDAPAGSAERRTSESLAEALTAELTRLGAGRLGVIGPATTRRYDGTATPVERIRDEIGAAHVLSGTLRRDGDSVRVFVQLIRTADRRHVLAERHAAPAAGDVAPLAARVGAAVAARLLPAAP